jgi:hypothetical protein
VGDPRQNAIYEFVSSLRSVSERVLKFSDMEVPLEIKLEVSASKPLQ